jgi:methionine synthase I (cobalamin-dependent)
MKPASVTVMDAGLGTRLLELGLDLKTDDPCLWVESHPEIVMALHAADIAAGARIVTADTFGANRSQLARFGREAHANRINRRAVEIARQAASESPAPCRIAGSVGPTALASERALREQVDALDDAGVDLIVFETLNAEQAAFACRQVRAFRDRPLWFTLWKWGDDAAETARLLADEGIAAWGVNCVADEAEILRVFESLHAAGCPATVLRSSIGPTDAFVRVAKACVKLGASHVGGCCGTSAKHVAALAEEFRHDPHEPEESGQARRT